ncbi:MAG: hypothetical protein UY41_C0011G0003 [Candidatus Moranbacteria bacterium GW2011_GWE1_49_15]|nr:MAG: hypothetical protein UX75_C0030G0003 [Candidatus Moranbacteria bacterium GW2011_GWE2_47_10]KKW06946.1 MAG: hypothetical protein UY41_C0011G0003 [Candidatus Moranbacteria bacterium GW2011_GWE1_49_15]
MVAVASVVDITDKKFFIIMGTCFHSLGKGKAEKRRMVLLHGFDKLVAFESRSQAEEFMVKTTGDSGFAVLAKGTDEIVEFMKSNGFRSLLLNPGVEKSGDNELSLASLQFSMKVDRQQKVS